METNSTKKIILTNKLEIDIIELPKIIGKEKDKDQLLDWLYFLENPKSERVTEKMKENKQLKEAVKRLDSLSEDEYMQKIADLREKAIRDENATYSKGLDDGIKRGTEIGKQQGVAKRNIEIIKRLYENKLSIEKIAKIMEMENEEVRKILSTK